MILITILSAAADTATGGGWSSIPPGAWALAGTVVGTIGLKLLERWLNRSKDKNDTRRDLNAEIKDLVERVDKLEDEVTEWRSKFYTEQEQVALLRTIIINMGGTLPENVAPDRSQ